MKYLLDTHIFLWSLNNDRRIKDPVKEILIDPGNIIYVSQDFDFPGNSGKINLNYF